MPTEPGGTGRDQREARELFCSPGDAVIYEGPIRAGTFGQLTAESYRVRLHAPTDTAYLEIGVAEVETFYASGDYREAYNASRSIESYQRAHDNAQRELLTRIDVHELRGRVVADVGCGGGSLLDLLSGLAADTIAVEPNREYHAALEEGGHTVFTWARDLAAARGGCLDMAFCLQVVEHVPDPVALLREIAACIRPGGQLIVTTPNRHDILGKLGLERFDRFRYRTAHLWYFSRTSFVTLARSAGLELVDVSFEHRYDAGNLVRWLRDGRPTGRGGFEAVFDETFEGFLRGWLESKGWADNLLARLRVPAGDG